MFVNVQQLKITNVLKIRFIARNIGVNDSNLSEIREREFRRRRFHVAVSRKK